MANTSSSLTNADISQQSATLRTELKDWERAFAVANGGRKASREDIRKDVAIAAKYKAYARLKSGVSSTTEKDKDVRSKEPELPPTYPELQQPKSSSRKRRSSNLNELDDISTPRKAARQDFVTPSKPPSQKSHPSQLDPYDSPSTLRKLFNPDNHQNGGYQSSSPLPLRAAIGPTPQRDGKALGLFDLLSASGGSRAAETPSARKSGIAPGGMTQTPSKQRNVRVAGGNGGEVTPRARRHSLTPASSGKKFLYSNFVATPIALRYSTATNEEDGKPSTYDGQTDGASKRQPSVSGTPSFLRRTNPFRRVGQGNTNGEMDSTSPIAVRMPQKLVGKGLSALMKGLRDMEDEKMDEDMEVLREIENEEMANSNNKVDVGDSQDPGNDGEDVSGETEETNGQYPQNPTKQWKKKGQKRTTRRVNIKPVRSKPKPEPKWKANVEDIEEESEGEAEDEPTVPATQPAANTTPNNLDTNADSGSDYGSLSGLGMSDMENYNESDDDYDRHDTSKSATKKGKFKTAKETESSAGSSTAKKSKGAKKKDADAGKENKENEKPKGKKVNPLAHANFRTLKIRNRGSKARGKGGRFGRRK